MSRAPHGSGIVAAVVVSLILWGLLALVVLL